MKKDKQSVPVQKGKIESNQMTMRHMPYDQRVKEREKEYKDIRSGQDLTLHVPRKGRS